MSEKYLRGLIERNTMLQKERDMLREALVGLLGGASTREELERIEAVVRKATVSEQDRAVSLNAIHALLATLKE